MRSKKSGACEPKAVQSTACLPQFVDISMRSRKLGFLFLIYLLHHGLAANVIHVSPNGTSSSSCWTGGEDSPCDTLQLALTGLQSRFNSKDTTILVHGLARYSLPANSSSTIIRGASNVAILGKGDPATIDCQSAAAGLMFVSSSNVSIIRLIFSRCGKPTELPDDDRTALYRTALSFVQCNDVQLIKVTAIESTGRGVLMDSCTGQITINESHFIDNHFGPFLNSDGGGMIIRHNSTLPVMVTIINSVFTNNTANTYLRDHLGDQGKGGGLALFLYNRTGQVSVSILGSRFSNNRAIHGGGVYLQYEYESGVHHDIVVNISSSTFESNFCNSDDLAPYDIQGGGLAIVYAATTAINSSIVIEGCNFTDNYALFGGGLSIVLTKNSKLSDKYLQLSNCVFEGNRGLVGYAFHSCSKALVTDSLMPCIVISESVFKSNHLIINQGLTDGLGAVNNDKIPLCLQGEVSFMNNNGTALVMSVSTVSLLDSSSVVFTGNTGHNGGALSLLNTALLTIGRNCRLLFSENRAHLYGGALYVAHFGYQSLLGHTSCFIQYSSDPSLHPEDWNASFTFRNNIAGGRNNSIYAPTVLPCYWQFKPDGIERESVNQTFCWSNWNYHPSDCTKQQIWTAVARIVHPLNSSQLHVYPGKTNQLPLVSENDFGRNVSENSLFSARFEKGFGAATREFISNNSMTAYGEPGTTHSLILDTMGPRVIHSEVSITFLHCPPGFIISRSTTNHNWSTCVCGQGFRYTVRCQPSEFVSYLHWGNFLSYDESTDTIVGGAWAVAAPKTSLSKDGYNPLPQNIYELNNYTCSKLNRQGYLCAECINGTSAPVNYLNYECVNCTEEQVKYNWLLFVVQEILPATIFFFVVVIFNISATSGPANAYVFFAQMVTNPLTVAHYTSQLEHVFPGHEWAAKLLLSFFILPYSIWNLDFFSTIAPPYCIARNMRTIDTFALQYLLAFYPLVLICLTYVCIELHARGYRVFVWMWKPFGRCVGRWRRNWEVRTSIIDAFATFFLLAYTKLCLVSFYMLIPLNTYSHTGEVTGPPRVFSDMSVEYASTEHIYQMVFALLVIIFILLLPPIFLIIYPFTFFQRFITRCRIDSTAVRTLVEAFQGSYKDGTNGTRDCRYFASMYFLMRLISFCVLTATSDIVLLRLIDLVTLFLFIASIAMLHPYKKPRHTLIDLFILTILGLVLSFAFYNAAVPNGSFIINAFLMIFTVVPVIFMTGLVIRHLVRQNKNKWKNHSSAGRSRENERLLDISEQIPDRINNPDKYHHGSIQH